MYSHLPSSYRNLFRSVQLQSTWCSGKRRSRSPSYPLSQFDIHSFFLHSIHKHKPLEQMAANLFVKKNLMFNQNTLRRSQQLRLLGNGKCGEAAGSRERDMGHGVHEPRFEMLATNVLYCLSLIFLFTILMIRHKKKQLPQGGSYKGWTEI